MVSACALIIHDSISTFSGQSSKTNNHLFHFNSYRTLNPYTFVDYGSTQSHTVNLNRLACPASRESIAACIAAKLYSSRYSGTVIKSSIARHFVLIFYLLTTVSYIRS